MSPVQLTAALSLGYHIYVVFHLGCSEVKHTQSFFFDAVERDQSRVSYGLNGVSYDNCGCAGRER
jgi:hypothetical protein